MKQPKQTDCHICNGTGKALYSHCCESAMHNGKCMDCHESCIPADCHECDGLGVLTEHYPDQEKLDHE